MAKAYLGKISALVTANTSDFNSKLNASAKEVRSFASSMQSALRRAEDDSSKSLRSIYTEAQKVERALKAAGSLRLSFKGFDSRNAASLEQAAAAMQRMVSATELINKPLSAATKSVQSLSAGVQAQFLPALILAQRGAEAVNAAISRSGEVGERSFARVENQVNQTIVAIDRLREAAAGISSLPTGNELRFVNPALVEQQQRAAAAQQRLASLPPSQAAGFRDLVISQRAAAERSIEANARLEAARIQQQRNPFRAPGDVAAAEQNLQAVLAAERLITEEIESQIGLIQQATAAQRERAAAATREFTVKDAPRDRRGLGLFGSQAGTDEERAIARARELSAEYLRLPKNAQAGLAGLAGIASRVADEVEAGTSDASALNAVLDVVAKRVGEAASQVNSLAEANSRLNVLQDESAQLSRQGAFGGPQSPPLPPGFGGRSDAGLGSDITDPQRQFESLRSSIVSVKGQIDQLPAGVRQQLIPAIREAEAEFLRLAAAPDKSAEAIERARQRLDGLIKEFGRVQSSQSLLSFGDANEQLGFREAAGQLQAAQQLLFRIGETANGPVAAAYERLRAAQQKYTREGTIGTPLVRLEILRLSKEVATLASQTGKISFSSAFRQIQQGGSVAAGAMNNTQLAVQQAVFAFEDFFSVTGDLGQRVRAAGNNLSQLGFILGSTKGLVAGVAIGITGQITAAIIKWATETDLQEAKLRALNDALSSQQASVESLAEAYRNLAIEISKSGATPAERRRIERDEQIRSLRQQADEAQRERVVGLSPDVARLRGQRGILEQQLQNEPDLRRRIEIQAAIERTRRQEQAAAARGIPAPTRDEVQQQLVAAEEERIRQTRVRLNRATARRDLGGAPVPGEDVDALRQELARRQADLIARRNAGPGAGQREQLGNLRQTRDDLEAQRQRVVASGARTTEIDAAIDNVTKTILRLEAALAPAVQTVVESITRRSLEIADSLGQSAELINRSVADSGEARAARREAQQASAELARIQRAADQASSPEEARSFIPQITAARRRAQAVQRRADAIEESRIVDAPRSFDARQGRARQALSRAGLESGEIARQLRQIEADRERLVRQLDSENPFERRRAERELDQLDPFQQQLEAAAMEVERFSEAIQRATQEAEANLQAAQRNADDARASALGFNSPANEEVRNRAQSFVDEQRQAAARVAAAAAQARDRLEFQAARGNGPASDLFPALRDINEQLAVGNLAVDERASLLAERAAIEQQINDLLKEDADLVAARNESTRLAQQQASIERGRELSMTPAQRAAESLASQINDVENYFDRRQQEILDRTGGLPAQADVGEMRRIEAERGAAIERVVADAQRATIPAIAAIADAVENALLQGPSRAALNVSDVSTAEGSRELSRLLRGDDSARNVNIVELQRQSQQGARANTLLEQILQKIGITIDLK